MQCDRASYLAGYATMPAAFRQHGSAVPLSTSLLILPPSLSPAPPAFFSIKAMVMIFPGSPRPVVSERASVTARDRNNPVIGGAVRQTRPPS